MSRNIFSVNRRKTYLNEKEFTAKGLRCSNALYSEKTTSDLIENLQRYTSYGVNTISVFFMGNRFGDIKGYNEDGTLNSTYAGRMGRIIEAANELDMVVLVGCLYWGNSRSKWDDWTQQEANRAVMNTVAWLKEHDYRNLFIDVDNEGMARREKGFDNGEMVRACKAVDPSFMIATNYRGLPPFEADLAVHHSEKDPDKPYIESEGSPGGVPCGGYWGSYSKVEGYYNYINVGVYTGKMKENQKKETVKAIAGGDGYLLASTWLQARPPKGPNHSPGGEGTKEDPGIKWWLEFLREEYGPYYGG